MNDKKILVIDDARNIRLTVRHALESLGIACEEAVNGEDALAKIKERNPDLILLDLMMPGMGGAEFLRRLRDGGCWTKVLIITAYGTVDNAVEVMKLGAIDFIQKPFSPDQIRQIVSQALRRDAGFLRRLRLTPGQYRERFSRVLPDEELRRIKGEAGAGEQEDYDFCLQQARAAVEATDFASAEAWAEKAVAVEPAGPDGFNLLGGLRELRGDRLQAQKYYQAALALDPGHLPARSNLRRSTELSAGGTPDLGGGEPPVPRGRGLRSAKRSRLGKESS